MVTLPQQLGSRDIWLAAHRLRCTGNIYGWRAHSGSALAGLFTAAVTVGRLHTLYVAARLYVVATQRFTVVTRTTRVGFHGSLWATFPVRLLPGWILVGR